MRTPISERRERLEGAVGLLKAELKRLQESCPHSNATKEYKSNTGNYDPSANAYWVDFRCPDCGKWWQEDQ